MATLGELYGQEVGGWDPFADHTAAYTGGDVVPQVNYADTVYNRTKQKVPTYVNSAGKKISILDENQYEVLPSVSATHGADNKYAAIQSILDRGAYYDPSVDFWEREYWVPKTEAAGLPKDAKPFVGFYDENPEITDEWGLLPYLVPLALGAIGGGALGLFGGAAGAGEAVAGMGAGGGIGGSTGVAGLGLGTGSAGLGLGTSAVGGSLFTAAELAAAFPGLSAAAISELGTTLANAGVTTMSDLAELAAQVPTPPPSGGAGGSGGAGSSGGSISGTGGAQPYGFEGQYVDNGVLYNSNGSVANANFGSQYPGYDPAAGLSGADYGSSLTQSAADALTNGGSAGVGSVGGMLSSEGVASGLTGLIQEYGQPLAKALGLTNADGSIDWAKVASGALSGIGGLLSGNAASDAAQTQSDAIIQAARIAAEAAKFKPVGVTTRFGKSQFGYDANGNLTSAGYTLTPDIKAQQDRMMGVSNNALTQYEGAQAATAPMGTAAQTMMALGNSYLSTTPEQQAQQYMNEQLALLAAPREYDMAKLQERLNATGRGGLAIGGGDSGALAANPELNAYYNSLRQQDLGLAANATQGGMDYAKFGAGMVGSGGQMLQDMYSTQSAAYDPYKTALGGASYLEGLGQNAMDLGINIGAKGTASNAQAGMLMANGLTNAAAAMAPANAYSPWGSLLSGAGNAVSQYSNPQQQYNFDPFTGRAL